MTREEAETIAARALGHLGADAARLRRFIDLTGVELGALGEVAASPDFLAAVLDHMLADESLLLDFTESQGLAPEAPGQARDALAGHLS
jgi:hypothetical protein